MFTTVVYALTSGTESGLWRRLHRAVLDELGARGKADWTSAIAGAASVRAPRGDR